MKKPISADEQTRLEIQAYALLGKLCFAVANEGNSRGRLRRLLDANAKAAARADRRGRVGGEVAFRLHLAT
jgi:hypothetical protein